MKGAILLVSTKSEFEIDFGQRFERFWNKLFLKQEDTLQALEDRGYLTWTKTTL